MLIFYDIMFYQYLTYMKIIFQLHSCHKTFQACQCSICYSLNIYYDFLPLGFIWEGDYHVISYAWNEPDFLAY